MIGKYFYERKGFTLVEVLIAMTIFMMFAGVLINSYASIVKSQRESNEYRLMYSEAGAVFDTIVGELRDGMVDYVHFAGGMAQQVGHELYLVRKDGMGKTRIIFDSVEGDLIIQKGELDAGGEPGAEPAFGSPVQLNSGVKVKTLNFYISPIVDPYDEVNVGFDLYQFHPKVTVFAEFEKNVDGKVFTMPLQTTVSSRIYNQIYKTDY